MTAARVISHTARIDATRTIDFSFDGRRFSGHPGDTLASALLAADQKLLARSFKYGRPRGIVGAGAEEPNALVQLETGALTTPNVKATQIELYAGLQAARTSGWPSLRHDIKATLGVFGRFMPAGFYSKTFKWPATAWPRYEAMIRRLAGFGHAPDTGDLERYDHLHHHVDVLVVGAGACGLLAAVTAARAGQRTLLIDEQSEPGGWLLSTPQVRIDQQPAPTWLASIRDELSSLPNAQVLTRTTGFGLYDQNLLLAVELLQDHLPPVQRDPDLPRQRQHRIRARQIVLATGAIERPLVFGNNDLPGTMTLAAGITYLNRYAVRAGSRVLIQGNNDRIYEGAAAFAGAGASVIVADVRPGADPASSVGAGRHAALETALDELVGLNGADTARLRERIEVRRGVGIARVRGGQQVDGATLINLRSDANGALVAGGQRSTVSADLVLSSAGLSPTVHLWCHNGARPTWRDDIQAFVAPAHGRADLTCVGAVTGAFELDDALGQTINAMSRLLPGHALRAPRCALASREPAHPVVRIPDGQREGHGAKALVDYQNDVTAADIALAVRENYHSIEHVKRYTALGFGTDQGKLSNVNGVLLTAKALGRPVAEVGTTTYRPAYTPVSFGALAGVLAGDTFEPVRTTALHASHEAAGARWEPVGQWLRPRYTPKAGESMDAAVIRESLAARHAVAAMDASTLGKIQIDGPDAREFLNRVYSNAWSKLEPGRCRYGLMLDENGMVMDDGVTACIHETQFYMTASTGNAAKVMTWLERWHQTEWPELRVWLSSVTDHWSTIAVVGPRSRELLQLLCDDIDLSTQAFRFMDWREGTVAGVRARVFRISFSGEVAFEVNVESGYGRHVWDEVMRVGEPLGITPYGTETMHVLRAEKGYIIVGQDTDGSMSPIDLGLSWAVGMNKSFPFLGKRSLTRSDTVRSDRKQLVGLLTDDPKKVLAEGAQIVETLTSARPVTMLGHVTSSYFSAFLGRSIALAVVVGGHAREGDVVQAVTRGLYATPARIVSPVFVDPEGVRQHG